MLLNLLFGLSLAISAAASGAESNGDPCIEAGGIRLNGNTCACPNSDRTIDPLRQDCLSESVQWINQTISMQPTDPCPIMGNGRTRETNLLVFSNPGTCDDPAKYICDPQSNSALKMLQNAETEYKSYEKDAFKAINAPNVLGYYSCDWLDRKEKEKCIDLLTQNLEPKIYTKQRKEIINEIFEKSRSNMIHVLESRIEFFRARPKSEMTIEYLKQSIQRIRSAELVFSAKPGFGAQAHSESSKLLVGGLALMADINPYVLYKTILHELGHLAALNAAFRVTSDTDQVLKPYDPSFPFDREMRCLIPDSMKTDVKCIETLEKIAQDPAQFIPSGWREKLSHTLHALAEEVRKNPYIAVSAPWPNLSRGCPVAKHEEALADFIAAEAFSKTLETGNAPIVKLKNQARVQAMLALFCDKQGRYPADDQLEKGTRKRLVSARHKVRGQAGVDDDSHPSSEFRINRIYMAHPLIRAAVGCRSDGFEIPFSSPQSQDEFTPRYCGLNLYSN